MTFDPKMAFIDCPKCDSAFHVERIKGSAWFCNCCAHQFEASSSEAGTAPRRNSAAGSGSSRAALQFAAILLLLMPALASAQGRVFFEPGDGSSKAVTDCTPTTTSWDGVPHRSGSALECGWDGTLGWQDSAKTRELELSAVPMTAELFADAWFRVDANVDRVAGSKLMRFSFGAADVIIACQFEQQPDATLFMSVGGQPSFWGGTAASQCRQGWQRLRVYMSRTLIRLWLGDVLLREWTGSFAVNGMVAFMSNWSDNAGWSHDAANHVYWQGVQVFSDAGTGGVGSMREGAMTQGGAVTPPVSSATYTCAVTGTPSSYADGDVRRTIRCDTNGPVTSLPVGATFTVTVPRK